MKKTILIALLNVALPTVDVFKDVATTSKLYSGYLSHEDCDEKRELEPFGFHGSKNVYYWAEAKDKCMINRGSTSLLIRYGGGHHNF